MTNIFIDNRTGEKVNVDDETAAKYAVNPAIFTPVVEGAEEVKEEAPAEEVVEEVVEEKEEKKAKAKK